MVSEVISPFLADPSAQVVSLAGVSRLPHYGCCVCHLGEMRGVTLYWMWKASLQFSRKAAVVWRAASWGEWSSPSRGSFSRCSVSMACANGMVLGN